MSLAALLAWGSVAHAGGVLLVGPQASAIHVEGDWDVAVGGGALAGWWHPGRLALVATGLSGLAVSKRGGGRAAAELAVGVRAGAGAVAGLSAGAVVELDRVQAPRLGAQATAWLSAGVTPFVRVARVAETGSSVEVGVAVVLPSLRW